MFYIDIKTFMDKKKRRPFNLLYKVDAQLTLIDKVYEIVVGPVRLVVVLVMAVVLIVFGFRFTLDAKLNDLIKESKTNLALIQKEVIPNEKKIRNIKVTIDMIQNYSLLYKDMIPVEATQASLNQNGLYRMSDIMTRIKQIENQFANRIVVSNYFFTVDNGTKLKLTGGASSFADIDSFVLALRGLDIVQEVSTPSQGSTKGDAPRYTIDIIFKDQQNGQYIENGQS